MYELLALGIIAIAALFFQGWLFMKERKTLLDRIMAKDYSQFEYYQKMFKEEVDEMSKLRDEARVDREKEDEFGLGQDKEFEKEKAFLANTEEDWHEDEVDMPELRKILNKSIVKE